MARQPKSGTKRKREKKRRSSSPDAPISASTGVMGSMVGGLRKAVGVGGGKKKGSVLGNLLWLLLLAIAAGILFYRYNQ